MKELYFEELFTQRVKRFPYEIDGKLVDFVIVCNNKSLDMFFNKLYKKYKIKHSYNDFMNECIYWTYFAIQRFHIRDEGSWEGILDGSDKTNIGRLISNIRTTVENEIIRFVNDKVLYTTKRENGVKKHVRYTVTTTSMDAVFDNGTGELGTLYDIISSKNSYWEVQEGYELNHFMKWFHENRKRILTKSQNQFLDNLAKAQHLQDGMTPNDIEEVTGVSDRNRSTYIKRIYERTLKAWQKENPMGQKTQLQMAKEAELELWTPLIDLIYTDEIEGQNKRISDWFVNNMVNETVANLVYDNLEGVEENKAVTDAIVNSGEQKIIPAPILYKLVAKVEERLDYIQQMDTTSKPIESNPENKKRNIEYANYKKKFIEQPCYVYDKDGNLKEIIPYKPFKEKVNTVHEVLPTGVVDIQSHTR